MLPLTGVATVAAADDRMRRATTVTQSLLEQAHRSLHSPDSGAELSALLDSVFAFDLWVRFLTKDFEGEFDKKQRKELREMLPQFLAHLYVNQFSRGLDQPPQVGGSRAVRRGDVLVSSEFPRTTGRALPVDWRLRDFPNNNIRVVDVMVGGASFLIQTKEDFRIVIKRDGPDGLLIYLRDRSQ